MYVLSRLVALAASLLDGFDVNVTEIHHKKKLDAPSGTAKMLADVIKSSCVDENTPDVSINSIRGGTAVGKHEISFFGNYETLTLTHEACCKDVYAVGALRALRFLMTKKVGLFPRPTCKNFLNYPLYSSNNCMFHYKTCVILFRRYHLHLE